MPQVPRSRSLSDVCRPRHCGRRAASASITQAQDIDQRRQRRRLLTTTRIVQKVSGERLAPVVEHAYQLAAREVRDTPTRFAARVKLRSSATARKAARTFKSSSSIGEWYSHPYANLTVFSGQGRVATLRT